MASRKRCPKGYPIYFFFPEKNREFKAYVKKLKDGDYRFKIVKLRSVVIGYRVCAGRKRKRR